VAVAGRRHLLARSVQWQPPAAEIAVDEVDEVDETAHDDPQSLRIGRPRAPSRTVST
jgi:hypothetical protein